MQSFKLIRFIILFNNYQIHILLQIEEQKILKDWINPTERFTFQDLNQCLIFLDELRIQQKGKLNQTIYLEMNV